MSTNSGEDKFFDSHTGLSSEENLTESSDEYFVPESLNNTRSSKDNKQKEMLRAERLKHASSKIKSQKTKSKLLESSASALLTEEDSQSDEVEASTVEGSTASLRHGKSLSTKNAVHRRNRITQSLTLDSSEEETDKSDENWSASRRSIQSAAQTTSTVSELEDAVKMQSNKILDSENDSDDSDIIASRKTRRKQTNVRFLESSSESDKELANREDTDDEEDVEIEERALSPRTRMSITGQRPLDMSEDESEIESSEEESIYNEFINKEAVNSEQDCKHKSADEIQRMDASPECSTQSIGTPVCKEIPAFNSTPYNQRYTLQFQRDLLQEKLSSTALDENDEAAAEEKIKHISEQSSSDVEIVSLHQKTIHISDSDDDVKVLPMPMHDTPKSTHAPTASVQPKLTTFLQKQKPVANAELVSKEFYEKELQKLSELRSDLSQVEKLYGTIYKNLPDGGSQLLRRRDKLIEDVLKKEVFINTLQVASASDEEVPKKQSPLQQLQQARKAINRFNDWDEISAAMNAIQPLHTGKQGLATFENQKALTVDRLKDLHGSLETCPNENVLAEDPIGLKVPLMRHQKHALAWMMWRERQKPHGGILADDMGLGKTLTTIALILSSKLYDAENAKNKSTGNADSDRSRDSDDDNWMERGKRKLLNGGTLIICPASLIRQWEEEIANKLMRNKLRVCVHHGNQRDTKAKHLTSYDVVVTTYQLTSREVKAHGALMGVRWKRIVLDEAHMVRNHKSQTSIAVCSLRGKRRWSLTGTPIQNKQMDMYALLKFLRCSPFDDLAHYKRWVDNNSSGGQQRLHTLMKTLLLRRTKAQLQQCGELNDMPEKNVSVVDVLLDKDEMNVYQKIMVFSRSLFAEYLMQRAERNTASAPMGQKQLKDPNGEYYKMHQRFAQLHHRQSRDIKSHQILVLLLRLRQICCHPGLIDAMLEDDDSQQELNESSDATQPEMDLLEQLNKMVISDSSSTDTAESHVSKASAKVLQRSNPVFDLNRPSSKMLKVLSIIENKIVGSNDKAVIVSQWTNVLNILKAHLQKRGILTLSLNGQIAVKDRQDIINKFNKPHSGVSILLLSLTAGGVGLNLVGANHLMLIDLHWNPQLEAQAADRIYRVGQKKNVYIYKFMCKETVEERIKQLQEKKLAIADGVLTGVKLTQGSKLSIDDLKNLFGL